MVLSAPAEVRGVPAGTAVCVPGPTKIRSLGQRTEPDMPASIDELTLPPHRMAEFAAGRIVTAAPDLVEPDDVFPPHSEHPRLDRLALALLRASDAEAVAPYLAIIRRELALRPGTDALIALEARLSPADAQSRPPARAPGIQRLSKALRALCEDRPPEYALEVMAEDLHFLSLFEDGEKAFSREALERLMTDMKAEPEPRRPARKKRADGDRAVERRAASPTSDWSGTRGGRVTAYVRRILGRGAESDDQREYRIRLVFALGNPGSEYAGNRRNVGFWVANRLARKHGMEFSTKTGTYALAEGKIGGRPVAIAKTRTFNNDSGTAVMGLIRKLKLDDARELLAVCDHLDLPTGKMRIRRRGGGGGQKGMADIIEKTRTDEFPRVRIGIGRPVVRGEPSWEPEHVAAWVLSDPGPEERALLDAAVERAIAAIECAITEGIDVAMNRCNRDDGAGPDAESAE